MRNVGMAKTSQWGPSLRWGDEEVTDWRAADGTHKFQVLGSRWSRIRSRRQSQRSRAYLPTLQQVPLITKFAIMSGASSQGSSGTTSGPALSSSGSTGSSDASQKLAKPEENTLIYRNGSYLLPYDKEEIPYPFSLDRETLGLCVYAMACCTELTLAF